MGCKSCGGKVSKVKIIRSHVTPTKSSGNKIVRTHHLGTKKLAQQTIPSKPSNNIDNRG